MKNIARLFVLFYAIIVLFFSCDYFMDFEPPQVKILSPASGEKSFGNVEIIIEAMDDKKLRNVELYLDGNMTRTFLRGPYTYRWDLTKTNVDAEHTIKAKAFDKGGNWAEKEVYFFGYGKRPETPFLIIPETGTIFNNGTPTLDWSDVASVTVYQLQVDKSGNFTSLVIADSTITKSTYSIASPLEEGLYYWRVRARYNPGNWGAWSTVRNFTIKKHPSPPTPLSPADGSSTNDDKPTFDWSDVAGAAEYQFQVDTTNNFSPSPPMIDKFGLTASTYNLTEALREGTYYWRVRARDNVGNWGQWSSVWSFTIKISELLPPTLLSPTNGLLTEDKTPSFDWSDVAGAVEYQFQVDTTNNFSPSPPMMDKFGLTVSNYNLTETLGEGTYSWRVRARDNVGNWSQWSSVWNFTIKIPELLPPTLLSPANGSSTNDKTPSFDWSDVAGAVEYQLQIDNNNNFSSLFVGEFLLTASSYNLTEALEEGTYYWRVRAKDNMGNWSKWSEVWSFNYTPVAVEWSNSYGGSGSDRGNSVQQTQDGGFIITGATESYGAGDFDVWLIKTDASGNTIWNRTFGDVDPDEGRCVQQTSDGGYIIAGYTHSYGAGGGDVWLIKTDASGNEIWDRTFGKSDHDCGESVQQTLDGGYVITGSTYPYGPGALGEDVWLIKTNSLGNEIWNRIFDMGGSDCGKAVQQTSDGGYIIVGYIQYGGGRCDVLLIKTDDSGNEIWNRTFGGNGFNQGYSVQETLDGGYIVTGSTDSGSEGGMDIWLIKIDDSGNESWNRTFGGVDYDESRCVQQTSDGGYIITGGTSSYGYFSISDVWLIKTDTSGNEIWNYTFGGSDYDVGNSVQQTLDGGYIIAGTSLSYAAASLSVDVLLIKVR